MMNFLKLVKEIIKADEYLINQAGNGHKEDLMQIQGYQFRKLIVDNYGPEVTIGGGSFSERSRL